MAAEPPSTASSLSNHLQYRTSRPARHQDARTAAVDVVGVRSAPDRGRHPSVDRELLWKVVGGLSGVAAGAAMRLAMQKGWLRVTGSDPPANPAAPGTAWSEALGWAAASGVAIAVSRMVAQRGAAGAWKATTGRYPEALDSVSP